MMNQQQYGYNQPTSNRREPLQDMGGLNNLRQGGPSKEFARFANEFLNSNSNSYGGFTNDQNHGIGQQPKVIQSLQMNNYQQPLGSRNPNEPNKSVSLDPREKKKLEREERIRREKQELEQFSNYNPFGKGGSGAPYRDQGGNVVTERRPVSNVRGSGAELRGLQNQMQQLQNPPANNSKITSNETVDQREGKYKQQLEYQEILRQQMEEKKAKENEDKRRMMEQDMRDEMRFKEELEKERQRQADEKSKKSGAMSQGGMSDNNMMPKKRNGQDEGLGGKVMHSPARQQSPVKPNVAPQNQPQQSANSRFSQPQQSQRLSQQLPSAPARYQNPPVNDSLDHISQYSYHTSSDYQPMAQRFHFDPKRNVDIMPDNMQLNINPALSNLHAPFIMGGTLINQIEKNFDQELSKLKNEMRNQQKEFENQLKQLRDEAQRNIDFRYKAEIELERARDHTQRDQIRPHMMDLSKALSSQPARRSMMNHNEFERMYFRKPTADNPVTTRGGAASMKVFEFNQQSTQNPPGHATILMPINFEGSNSLKAESVFVNMARPNDQLPGNSLLASKQGSLLYQQNLIRQSISDMRTSGQHQIPPPTFQEGVALRQSSKITQLSNQQPAKIPSDILDREVSLTDLQQALDEITALNIGEIPKKTEQQKTQDVIKQAMEQAEYLVESRKKFDPDSYQATIEHIEDAQVESQHYNITQQFLDQARVEKSQKPPNPVLPELNPQVIKKAKEPLIPEDYAKTRQELNQARAENEWLPSKSEFFPQLSPQALKQIKKSPAKEYQGLHSENMEISALLDKFQAASSQPPNDQAAYDNDVFESSQEL
ncbi:hypothetical protein FGO68_gene14556 [Halteria grandinella]|uniref:Uncharacterized protein n=1 Tax=Halteria grandinella TaxID=5974 RepID=A0A8J8T5M5_HALGN|nr:hypothetical protein FGO68_gene14556 [Halteria grandinella]